MFCIHPTDGRVRFSFFPIFRDGELGRMVLIREVDVLHSPAEHFRKFAREASIARELPKLEMQVGQFRDTEKCITPDCVQSEKEIDAISWSLEAFLGIADSTSGVDLPDGIQFWYPKSVADVTTKDLPILVLWQVDDNKTVASKIVYKKGVFTARYTAELFH